jgi:hypothetical protein
MKNLTYNNFFVKTIGILTAVTVTILLEYLSIHLAHAI